MENEITNRMPAEQSSADNHQSTQNLFPERLREAMRRQHMTASRLSDATGVDRGSISHYLSGRYYPKSERLSILAGALRVSEIWLRGYSVTTMDENPTASTDLNGRRLTTLSLTDEEINLLRKYYDADDRAKKIVNFALDVCNEPYENGEVMNEGEDNGRRN